MGSVAFGTQWVSWGERNPRAVRPTMATAGARCLAASSFGRRACDRAGPASRSQIHLGFPAVTHSAGLLTVLSEADRRNVLAITTRRRFAKGEVLFHEGDPGDTLHLIEKGHVAIRVSTALGDVATLTMLGPEDAFGEQALLTAESRRTASAIAMDAVDTRCLNRREFDALMRDHPEVHGALIELLAEQVRRLSDRLTEALFVAADVRVVRRVVELARVFGGEGPVTIPVTQDDIAAMAGTTRPTANRALKACAETGALVIGRGRIEVLDLAALERRAR